MTRTDAAEATEPKKEIIELQPGLKKGYITTAVAAKTSPSVKNIHIRPYAGRNHDVPSRGTTMVMLPRTARMLF